MSLSNPTLQNPAEHFFEWRGGDGHIEFYNKELQKRVTVPLPFEFIVLDQLNGVTGWSDQDNSRIWSNETRSTRDDFTVRTKKGVKYVGPYKNESGISQVAGLGGKYVKIVYIAHKNREGNYILGRIGLTGAALNAWIDFNKTQNLNSGKVRITGKQEEKKGATVFQVPIFEWHSWEQSEFNEAIMLDKLLQQYLNQYLSAPKYDENTGEDLLANMNTSPTATLEQVAEYERLKAEKLSHSTDGTTQSPATIDKRADRDEDRAIKEMLENDEAESINIDDIPF